MTNEANFVDASPNFNNFSNNNSNPVNGMASQEHGNLSQQASPHSLHNVLDIRERPPPQVYYAHSLTQNPDHHKGDC